MSLRARIDRLVAAQKEIAGYPAWEKTSYPGQWRWLAPLNEAGQGTNLKLIVDFYPQKPPVTFSILLVWFSAVQRLDYGPGVAHHNHEMRGLETPAGVQIGWIKGPHCHLWSDNRMLVRETGLPKELEFARLLPAPVQGFENAFRWFCGEVNVSLGGGPLPRLPERTMLV